IYACVVELREAESLRRQHAVQPRRIHRAGRPVTPPRPARHLIKLLPIAFVPSSHFLRSTFYPTHWMRRLLGRFASVPALPVNFLGASNFELFIYFIISSAKHFPYLLYQTRYGHICFAQYLQVARRKSFPEDGRVQFFISNSSGSQH